MWFDSNKLNRIMHCTRSHIVEGRQHHAVDRVGWIRGWIPRALLWGMGTTNVPGNAAHCLRALPGSSLRGIAILQEYIITYNNYYFVYTESFNEIHFQSLGVFGSWSWRVIGSLYPRFYSLTLVTEGANPYYMRFPVDRMYLLICLLHCTCL